jgi:hypothetical protein
MMKKQHLPLRVLLVILALASLGGLAVGLAGCGGQSADDLLKETFTGKKKFDSGKLNVTLNVDARGIPGFTGPASLKITGPFQTQGQNKLPKFALTAAISAQGQTFNAGATSTGDKGYLSLQGTNYEVPDDVFAQFRQGFEQGRQESGNKGLVSSIGLNPVNWAEDPKEEGKEDIGGVETVHITAKVNVSKFLDDINTILSEAAKRGGQAGQQVPNQISPQEKQRVQEAIKEATFDVFTNEDDKTLRKLEVHLRLEVPQEQRAQTGGLESANINFALEVTDLNKPQTISAPSNPRPFNELLSVLRSFGALGGQGGGQGGGGQGGGGGSS